MGFRFRKSIKLLPGIRINLSKSGVSTSVGVCELEETCKTQDGKVEREKIILAALPELSLQIVEFAREHGRVTIGDAIKLTGASRNTLKQHFRHLVERGNLNQHGSGRGVWYELR